MSYILHIETSTKSCSVALSFHGKLLSVKESNDAEFAHGEQLTLYIEKVIVESSIEMKSISAVSVTSGPGSYTGLRIGVSTAKGICFALDIPLIAIDSLINLAELAKQTHKNVNLCAMIDARRMEVYSAIYDASLNSLKPVTADIIDENSYAEFEPFLYFGDGAEKVQSLWGNRNVSLDATIFSSARGHVALAYSKFANREFEDLAYFEPFYLKDFVGGKKQS